jgi:hypothetical protein
MKDELQNFMDRKSCVRVFTIVAGIFQDRIKIDDANLNTCRINYLIIQCNVSSSVNQMLRLEQCVYLLICSRNSWQCN